MYKQGIHRCIGKKMVVSVHNCGNYCLIYDTILNKYVKECAHLGNYSIIKDNFDDVTINCKKCTQKK